MTRPLSTTTTSRGAFRAVMTAVAFALAAGPILATAAEAGGCGRGGYGMGGGRSVARAEYRQSKAVEKRVAANPARKAVAAAKASDPGIAEAVPANAAASALPAAEPKRVAAVEKAEAVVDAPEARTGGPVDCKQFVPGAGVTITVPCGR